MADTKTGASAANPGTVTGGDAGGGAAAVGGGAGGRTATIPELEAAFPGMPTFVLGCARDGLTMEQAKARRGELAVKELESAQAEMKRKDEALAAAKAENEQLRTVAPHAKGTEAVGASNNGGLGSASGAASTGGFKTFAAAVDHIEASEKVSKAKATQLAARRYPDLWSAARPTSTKQYAEVGEGR